MLIVLLSMQTLLRNAIWHDPVALSREAVTRSPGHWIPPLLVAEALRQRGRCGEAVPQYQTAIALRPQEEIPYAKLTECLISLRRFDEAEQTLGRLKQLSPSSQEAAMGLGLLALLQDRAEVSRALFEQAARHSSGNARAGAMLAFLEGQLPAEERQRICAELRSIAGAPVAPRTCASGGVNDPSASPH
jgi:Flp pilus assembly protein TadD